MTVGQLLFGCRKGAPAGYRLVLSRGGTGFAAAILATAVVLATAPARAAAQPSPDPIPSQATPPSATGENTSRPQPDPAPSTKAASPPAPEAQPSPPPAVAPPPSPPVTETTEPVNTLRAQKHQAKPSTPPPPRTVPVKTRQQPTSPPTPRAAPAAAAVVMPPADDRVRPPSSRRSHSSFWHSRPPTCCISLPGPSRGGDERESTTDIPLALIIGGLASVVLTCSAAMGIPPQPIPTCSPGPADCSAWHTSNVTVSWSTPQCGPTTITSDTRVVPVVTATMGTDR